MCYTPNERRVLALTGVAHFGAHFFELMFPTLAVTLARQGGVPLAEVLGWSFAGYLLFGLGALPAGLLTDRIGGRRMLDLSAVFRWLIGVVAVLVAAVALLIRRSAGRAIRNTTAVEALVSA